MMFPKSNPYRSEKWKAAVRDVGHCVRCLTECRPECAHQDEGKGMGMKTSDCNSAALCPPCHRELTDSKDLTREEKRYEMLRCIVKTVEWLAINGRIKIS